MPDFSLPMVVPASISDRVEKHLMARRGYRSIDDVVSSALKSYLKHRILSDDGLKAEIKNTGYASWRRVEVAMDSETYFALRRYAGYQSLIEAAILRQAIRFWEST